MSPFLKIIENHIQSASLLKYSEGFLIKTIQESKEFGVGLSM